MAKQVGAWKLSINEGYYNLSFGDFECRYLFSFIQYRWKHLISFH